MSDEDDEDIEGKIKVNNSVIDNELGGRKVMVLPAWEKIWNELKKGSVAPRRWLNTDRVMLNTVRWSGAYLCGMREHWSDQRYKSRNGGEILDKFFSTEMERIRRILQYVEWNIGGIKGGRDLLSIRGLEPNEYAQLT